MKIFKKIILSFLLPAAITTNAQVGIGTATPAASAQLDVSSTTKGFLPPRMTIAQRNGIPSPVTGLVIFCSDCEELEVYNGTIWKNMTGDAACSLLTPPNVRICNQVWMVKNLDVSTYKNGDPIPNVTDPADWAALTTGAYCYYNNDSATYAASYGKLYNWYAVNDPRGLAPAGWHVPSDVEWNILVKCIDPLADTTCNANGNCNIAGGPMKETGTTHWNTPNTAATNSSGFTALPAGVRDAQGLFFELGISGYLWSSSEINTNSAWDQVLFYTYGYIYRHTTTKPDGFSVRCLRD